jgi:hypothetical protein
MRAVWLMVLFVLVMFLIGSFAVVKIAEIGAGGAFDRGALDPPPKCCQPCRCAPACRCR